MKYLFFFFLFNFLACNSNNIKKETPTNTCKANTDCKSYSFCVDEICKDYIDHNFTSIEELNKLSILKFIIMSDNKGDGIEDLRFKNMVDWSNQFNSEFVIGLGDHVKINWENSFLDFLKTNSFWFNNFYPAIADGENEYYGTSQGDWGAGKKLLEFLNFNNKENTVLRENGAEYYTKITLNGLNIHLIQLHFPDTPADATLAWPQDSRDYLINTIKSINKTKNDLIIVSAHSISGSWYQYLTSDELKVIMDSVDLGLSATSHIFARYKIESHENDGTLFLNTGAITRPTLTNGEGFIYVFVLENPYRIVLQYIDAKKDKLEFDTRYPMFIKDVGGYLEEKMLVK
jgi:hypothetical protein